jgi:hypothetical protein
MPFVRGPYWRVALRGFGLGFTIGALLSVAWTLVYRLAAIPTRFNNDLDEWTRAALLFTLATGCTFASAAIDRERIRRLGQNNQGHTGWRLKKDQIKFMTGAFIWVGLTVGVFLLGSTAMADYGFAYFRTLTTARSLTPFQAGALTDAGGLVCAAVFLGLRVCVLRMREGSTSERAIRTRTQGGAKSALLEVDRSLGTVVQVVNFTGEVAFRIGVGIASAVALYYLLNWVPAPIPHAPNGRPDNPGGAVFTIIFSFWPVRLVVGGLLVAFVGAAVIDLWWIVIALLGRKPPLENEQAHGRAGRARPEQTASGAIGDSQREPVHTQRFRD